MGFILLRVKFLADQYPIICVSWGLSEDDLWGTYKKMVKIFINNWRSLDLACSQKTTLLYRDVHGKNILKDGKMTGIYSSIYSVSIHTIDSVTVMCQMCFQARVIQ